MTRTSLSDVSALPVFGPARILSVIIVCNLSVVEDRQDMDQRKNHEPSGKGDMQAEPDLQQVSIAKLRIDGNFQAFFLKEQANHLTEILLLRRRNFSDNEPQAVGSGSIARDLGWLDQPAPRRGEAAPGNG